MPTLVLTTPSNPGTATWTDATTLPAASPWTAINTGIILPAIPAGQLIAITLAGTFPGVPAGRPLAIGWGNTATVIKVWAHMPASGTVELIVEADNSQGFAGGAVSFDIYALNV
jgi:hypothetical protein